MENDNFFSSFLIYFQHGGLSSLNVFLKSVMNYYQVAESLGGAEGAEAASMVAAGQASIPMR